MPITIEAHGWRFTILRQEGNVVIDNKPMIDQARMDGRPYPNLQMCCLPLALVMTIAREYDALVAQE